MLSHSKFIVFFLKCIIIQILRLLKILQKCADCTPSKPVIFILKFPPIFSFPNLFTWIINNVRIKKYVFFYRNLANEDEANYQPFPSTDHWVRHCVLGFLFLYQLDLPGLHYTGCSHPAHVADIAVAVASMAGWWHGRAGGKCWVGGCAGQARVCHGFNWLCWVYGGREHKWWNIQTVI